MTVTVGYPLKLHKLRRSTCVRSSLEESQVYFTVHTLRNSFAIILLIYRFETNFTFSVCLVHKSFIEKGISMNNNIYIAKTNISYL